MKDTDIQQLMKHFAPMIAKQIADGVELARKEMAAAYAAAGGIPPVAGIDVNAAFHAANPGIGGEAPELDTETEVHPETGEQIVKDITVTFLHGLVKKLSDKLDALVQATGHGNSAAMGPHL